MKSIDKTYNIYDGTIGIWLEGRNLRLPFFVEKSKEEYEAKALFEEDNRKRLFAETRELYENLRVMMMNSGWTFHQDPEIKKHYRSICNDHHAGNKRGAHFLSSISGRHIEFKFYENVIRDNQHGGQYTSNKMKVMPYLLRLKVKIAIKAIVDHLVPLGYIDNSRVYPEEGRAAIMKHRAELDDFQGKDFYKRERHPYNCIDADNVEMYDGDLRYFWTWNGRLGRGTAYRNINNMWWVHTGPYSYTNVANFDLFTWDISMGRKRKDKSERVTNKMESELKTAIGKENFERAIVLRNLLRKEAA